MERDKNHNRISCTLCEKCLVVVFKERRNRRKDGHKTATDATLLFQQFVDTNKNCPWNPHLQESLTNIKLCGFLLPNTLLINGREIYIQTIKNAYARRVIQPPSGYSLQKCGIADALFCKTCYVVNTCKTYCCLKYSGNSVLCSIRR